MHHLKSFFLSSLCVLTMTTSAAESSISWNNIRAGVAGHLSSTLTGILLDTYVTQEFDATVQKKLEGSLGVSTDLPYRALAQGAAFALPLKGLEFVSKNIHLFNEDKAAKESFDLGSTTFKLHTFFDKLHEILTNEKTTFSEFFTHAPTFLQRNSHETILGCQFLALGIIGGYGKKIAFDTTLSFFNNETAGLCCAIPAGTLAAHLIEKIIFAFSSAAIGVEKNDFRASLFAVGHDGFAFADQLNSIINPRLKELRACENIIAALLGLWIEKAAAHALGVSSKNSFADMPFDQTKNAAVAAYHFVRSRLKSQEQA